jgi:protein-S-isoprenylcysteine O-methyltransferase Ste14
MIVIPSRQIVTACWVLFVAVWLVSSRFVKPTAERSSWTLRLVSVLPLVIAAGLLRWAQPPGWLGARLIWRSSLVPGLAAALTLSGLAVAFWARYILADNWSGMVTFKEGHELVRRGPYRYVRHPIYTGVLLMLLGTTILVGDLSGVVAFLLVLASFWFKLRQEEALLSRHFPEAYPAYRREVRALIPFVL